MGHAACPVPPIPGLALCTVAYMYLWAVEKVEPSIRAAQRENLSKGSRQQEVSAQKGAQPAGGGFYKGCTGNRRCDLKGCSAMPSVCVLK